MSCIMKGCPNSRRNCKYLSFFKLPPTDEKRKHWLDGCEAEFPLSKFPVVCSAHFPPSQTYMKGTRVRLRPDAVPMPLSGDAVGRPITKMDLRLKMSKKDFSNTMLDVRQKKSKKDLPNIELDFRQENTKIELPEFELELDDDYDLRCGEVFLTYSGVLVFHCSPCNKKYGSFIHFFKHLSRDHYKHIKEDLNHNEYEKSCESLEESILADNAICKENHEIKQEKEDFENIEEFIKIEIEPTVVQNTEDHFSEIEHFKETDNEYEELSCDEKLVDTPNVFSSQEDQEQLLTNAENPPKPKRKKCADKIFKCDLCSKIFKTKQRLRRHAWVHSSERKYKCEICGLGLKHYSYIKRHMLRHTGEKNISCDICDKRFYTNSEHKLHLRSHTGERPFVCSTCGLAFTNSGALTVHEKIHNIEPLFRCTYCDKGFYSQYKMKVHMIVHTKERPFICPVCSSSFPRKRSMLRHVDLRHKKSS